MSNHRANKQRFPVVLSCCPWRLSRAAATLGLSPGTPSHCVAGKMPAAKRAKIDPDADCCDSHSKPERVPHRDMSLPVALLVVAASHSDSLLVRVCTYPPSFLPTDACESAITARRHWLIFFLRYSRVEKLYRRVASHGWARAKLRRCTMETRRSDRSRALRARTLLARWRRVYLPATGHQTRRGREQQENFSARELLPRQRKTHDTHVHQLTGAPCVPSNKSLTVRSSASCVPLLARAPKDATTSLLKYSCLASVSESTSSTAASRSLADGTRHCRLLGWARATSAPRILEFPGPPSSCPGIHCGHPWHPRADSHAHSGPSQTDCRHVPRVVQSGKETRLHVSNHESFQ